MIVSLDAALAERRPGQPIGLDRQRRDPRNSGRQADRLDASFPKLAMAAGSASAALRDQGFAGSSGEQADHSDQFAFALHCGFDEVESTTQARASRSASGSNNPGRRPIRTARTAASIFRRSEAARTQNSSYSGPATAAPRAARLAESSSPPGIEDPAITHSRHQDLAWICHFDAGGCFRNVRAGRKPSALRRRIHSFIRCRRACALSRCGVNGFYYSKAARLGAARSADELNRPGGAWVKGPPSVGRARPSLVAARRTRLIKVLVRLGARRRRFCRTVPISLPRQASFVARRTRHPPGDGRRTLVVERRGASDYARAPTDGCSEFAA